MTTPAQPYISASFAREVAVAASADPRSVIKEIKEPGSVRGMSGERIRKVIAERAAVREEFLRVAKALQPAHMRASDEQWEASQRHARAMDAYAQYVDAGGERLPGVDERAADAAEDELSESRREMVRISVEDDDTEDDETEAERGERMEEDYCEQLEFYEKYEREQWAAVKKNETEIAMLMNEQDEQETRSKPSTAIPLKSVC
jgi:hypothetical protein